ncbi:DUF2066 domain-containing protein [Photobacterium aphoticum]|uniref:DUF2066 domain-containing protein n=1 Tax=Photobacterium aphoticum TaxID=754436 RepID=UPI000A97CEED|nr:DUF2066 domain-containing protein [Photobacterium aphoticum]GHA63136.1 hypothetical protein GCM10007086_41300 [Photobacterium aphoticum]
MLRVTLLFMALLALPLKAATMTNLYQAQVVLPDTDRQSEQVARQQALEQVLIRVSGQSAIGKNEVVAKALTQSGQYVSQFGYGNQDGQRTLALTFDARQIRTLLAQAKASFWTEQRPTTLVWMVEDDGRDRNILWDQSGSALVADMKQAAERRGVPVSVPIGDFQDVTAISSPDLWGGFVQPLSTASVRYQPEAILLARVRKQGTDEISINWQLFKNRAEALVASQQAPSEGRLSGATVATINQMMDAVADQLAAKYAVPLGAEASNQMSVVVGNITSSRDFFTLERMVTNLTSVAAVNAYRIQGDKVEFNVQLLSSEEAFKQELSQDSRLSAVAAPAPMPEWQSSEAPVADPKAIAAPQAVTPAVEPQTAVPAASNVAGGEISDTTAPQGQNGATSAEGLVNAIPATQVDVSATQGLAVPPVATQPVKHTAVFEWNPPAVPAPARAVTPNTSASEVVVPSTSTSTTAQDSAAAL